MIDRFLKAKHWQLFLLTFGIPIIFQIIIMGLMISGIAAQTNPDPTMMFNYMKFIPLITMVFISIFFGWFWSVAIGLQKKVPEHVTMKVKQFKVFFFIPLIYMLVFFAFFSMALNPNPEKSLGFIGGFLAVILPLHFFSMFCIFHSMYFVAKTVKTVELQREVQFGEFAGEFFMIWFYPVGVWIIQPKINKMIE